MTPAVKMALAYCAVTGSLPRHIHLKTWGAAHRLVNMIESLNERIQSGRMYELSGEAHDAVVNHPLVLASQHLTARGYRPDRRAGQRTSHYIRFVHPEHDGYALAFRHGGGSITIPVYAEGSRVFIRNVTEKF